MTIGELAKKWNETNPGSAKLDVFNPSTKELLGSLNLTEEIELAVKTAETHLNTLTPPKRAEILQKASLLLKDNLDEAGHIITLENGKPLKEAKGEVLYCAEYLEWYAEEAKRIYGEILPEWDPKLDLKVYLEPIGVVGVITPWNFPLSMLGRKVGAAIAAGCPSVAKPAPETPFSALFFEEILKEAGLPDGYFKVIISDAEKTGDIFCKNKTVRKISFTGSTEVGRILSSKADLKKLTMELGGNAPALVLSDCEMSVLKECGAFGKFRNAGQACTAINRFIIQESKVKDATDFLLEASKNIKVGDGFNADSTIGPLITEESLNRIIGLIEDATSKGAKILSGEVKYHGQFLEPVVLDGVTPSMRIFNEEIFGPVVSIIRAKSDEEVLTLANQTDYGLAAYVFSKHQGQKFAKRLDFGMVGINMVYLALVQAPFGGIKNSGFGREGGREGVKEFLKIKYVGEVS